MLFFYLYFWPFEIATMRAKLLLIFFLLLISVNALPQDSVQSVPVPEYFCLYGKYSVDNSGVGVSVPDTDSELGYESNAKLASYLGFHYSWLGVEYAFLLPPDEINLYGKTRSSALNIHIGLKHWSVDLKDRNYKGYYLSNPDEFDSGWTDGTAYPQLPDLEVISTSFSLGYLFRPDKLYSNYIYSYKKVPVKSGGSWLMNGFFSATSVYSDSLIVPEAIRHYADPGVDYKSIQFVDYGVSIGYSYLWALSRRFFTSVTALPGFSYQQAIETSALDGKTTQRNRISARFAFSLAFGYNTEKFYCGLISNAESKSYGSELDVNFQKVGLQFVYRFDTSSWKFMKGVDKLMHPRFLRFALGEKPRRE